VAAEGTLSNNRVFCDMSSAAPGVPDGIKVNTQGRVFCVGSGGIWVMTPSGDVIGIVKTPEVVRNLAFGGPDFRTLYLTPGGSLSTLAVKTPGIGACRSHGVPPDHTMED
jgi:gluconolactonase